MNESKTLKEIALELLEKYRAVAEKLICEYSGCITEDLIEADCEYGRIRKQIEKAAEPEIIRCKDCKWWGYDDDNEVVRVCHAAKHNHMSRNWSIMIYRTHKGDFYCADAERRTDE